MWLPVDGFLCPRSPVPWRGLLLGGVAAHHCPARCQLLTPAQLVKAAGWSPVPEPAATLMPVHTAPSVLRVGAARVWPAGGEAPGPAGLDLTSVLQRQFPQLSLAEGGWDGGWAEARMGSWPLSDHEAGLSTRHQAEPRDQELFSGS